MLSENPGQDLQSCYTGPRDGHGSGGTLGHGGSQEAEQLGIHFGFRINSLVRATFKAMLQPSKHQAWFVFPSSQLHLLRSGHGRLSRSGHTDAWPPMANAWDIPRTGSTPCQPSGTAEGAVSSPPAALGELGHPPPRLSVAGVYPVPIQPP